MKITLIPFTLICLVFLIFQTSCQTGFLENEYLPASAQQSSQPGINQAGNNLPSNPGAGISMNGTSGTGSDCTKGISLNNSRGECSESLGYTPQVSVHVSGDLRIITSNNIPAHKVGKFGSAIGSLNPNAIRQQSSSYQIDYTPALANKITFLSGSAGPVYSFGVLLNGVELDPVAAEPWPHERGNFANANWEWNLEATNVMIGLDCNNAHVQPTGKYHYHASPTLYLQSINASSNKMQLLGYAADGFPIYNKYAYSEAGNSGSVLKELKSSYRLKTGTRPGDGLNAPCGPYSGIYSNDFEYVNGLGDLDQCNGRVGVTPEYPNGTYYYVISDDFPAIPRCFKGNPSQDFKIGF